MRLFALCYCEYALRIIDISADINLFSTSKAAFILLFRDHKDSSVASGACGHSGDGFSDAVSRL